MDYFERLYLDTERYRIPMMLAGYTGAKRNIQEEHTSIAEAALARRADAACKLLADHYRKTAKIIQKQNDDVTATSRQPAAKRRRGSSEKSNRKIEA